MNSNTMNQPDNTYDWMVKILIIGDSAVGKTQILTRFAENKFSQRHQATLGVDFKIRTIRINDRKLKMHIWDSAGQDKFRSITQTYYRGASGIVLTYSIADRNSFQNIESWMNQIQQHSNPEVAKILVGNKSDLQRVVDYSEGRNLAQNYGMEFVECSAKDGTNIEDIFQSLGQTLIDSIESGTLQQSKQQLDSSSKKPNQLDTQEGFALNDFQEKPKGGCAC